ncbi:MAG: 4Fe-4S binding protein [Bacteroidales bacterium]|nr:4Fe-4S binding protein [Bacteroidales bacterium]
MLRKLRIFLAIIFFAGITALFLDTIGVVRGLVSWMADIQLLPAVLAANFLVVAAVLACTLVLGRIYCSVVCPLGVLQDFFVWLGGLVKKNRFKYRKPSKWLRYAVLALFVLAMVLGFNGVALLVAPYSAYGRMVAAVAHPATVGWTVAAVALVTLVVVAVLSLRWGRLWCNTICPVGTTLGLVSRFALLRPVVDKELCNGCGKCARNCKASCIDAQSGRVDMSRCVTCMDCLDNCSTGAMRLRWQCGTAHKKANDTAREGGVDTGLRSFVAAAAAVGVASTLRAQEKKVDGGLAVLQGKQVPQRQVPLKPYGAHSLSRFSKHCTACQLCVSACPNGVLRPSSSLSTMMQPEMGYDKGYCRPECTACGDVCPTGAIRAVSREAKTAISIGHAVVLTANCLACTGEASCGNCARHCPAAAISMIDGRPVVDESRCTGCGACEYLCPVRPFSAIYVEGREQHTAV